MELNKQSSKMYILSYGSMVIFKEIGDFRIFLKPRMAGKENKTAFIHLIYN